MKTRTLAPRFFAPFLLCLALFATRVEASTQTPYVRAPDEFVSAVVMVPKTHEVLYAYEAEKTHPAASLTKLVNALAFVRTKPVWNKIVALKKVDEVGGGRLRVRVGAKLSIQDVMYSSITASANNTATAMMRLSGKTPSGFLKAMNQMARQIGATNSTFVDPSGMDVRNTTTANDMALIAEKAFQEPIIHGAASAASYAFTVRNTGEHKVLHNTNSLLTSDPDLWIVGGKTGYLEESKYNLVIVMRPLNEEGMSIPEKELIVVVFGAPTKAAQFVSAKRLAQWAWQSYEFPRSRLTS